MRDLATPCLGSLRGLLYGPHEDGLRGRGGEGWTLGRAPGEAWVAVTGRLMMERLALVVALGLVLVVVLLIGNRTGSLQGVRAQIPFADAGCAPSPCAAPQGFEADVSNIQPTSTLLSMDITLRNRTSGGLEAVSYRHTKPSEFVLSPTDGVDRAPVFNSDCPNWDEVRVERGQTMGPMPLCFEPPRLGLQGAVLLWNPDVGLFSHRVSIPLA
jgi:hypothetical protein